MTNIKFDGMAGIVHGERIIQVRELRRSDLGEAADLYRSIHIHRGNYREKLSETSPQSFDKRGGMFLIQEERELEEIAGRQQDCLLVARNEEGRIVGLIWFGLEDYGGPEKEALYARRRNIVPEPGKENFYDLLSEHRRQGLVVYGKEIIFCSSGEFRGLGQAMFFLMFSHLLRLGYRYCTGEIYRIAGFEDEEGYHPRDLKNEVSLRSLISTGGIHMGHLRQKRLFTDGIGVDYEAEIVYWDMERAAEKIRLSLREEGTEIVLREAAEDHFADEDRIRGREWVTE